MTLKECLEVGISCGIQTVGESINNINSNATSIFGCDKANQELLELYRELLDLFNKTKFTKESLTSKVFEWIKEEDDFLNNID